MLTGTARKADLPGWQAAGKTGTSQDFRDAWFIGYTSQLVAGVWLGNDDSSPTKKASGGNLPVEIWSRFMTIALKGQPVAGLPSGAWRSETAAMPEEIAKPIDDLIGLFTGESKPPARRETRPAPRSAPRPAAPPPDETPIPPPMASAQEAPFPRSARAPAGAAQRRRSAAARRHSDGRLDPAAPAPEPKAGRAGEEYFRAAFRRRVINPAGERPAAFQRAADRATLGDVIDMTNGEDCGFGHAPLRGAPPTRPFERSKNPAPKAFWKG